MFKGLTDSEKGSIPGLVNKVLESKDIVSDIELFATIAEELGNELPKVMGFTATVLNSMFQEGKIVKYGLEYPLKKEVRLATKEKVPEFYYKLVK